MLIYWTISYRFWLLVIIDGLHFLSKELEWDLQCCKKNKLKVNSNNEPLVCMYIKPLREPSLRVSVSALCSVQLHTWSDAVSNKVRPPLMWCPTQRLLPPSRQYSNSLLDLPLQSSATQHRETLNLGPRQALLNAHSPPLGSEVLAGWVYISHGGLHISPPQPLQHHTYPPQGTGGLLGIGISAFCCWL